MQSLFSPRPVAVRDPSPSRRSLRSYLPGALVGKTRSSPDFFVEADDPHKRYSAGDAVTGTVSLRVPKSVRITHIVICLHGFVQVFKTPGAAPADHRAPITKGQPAHRGGAYHGNGFATLFEEEMVICGDGRLDAGRYRFKFSIKFPDIALPTSIDVSLHAPVIRHVQTDHGQFERGTIAYMLTATMTRPTTISPITYHDQKILYTQQIDTSRYLPPRPRTITLEPLVRSSNGRGSRKPKRSEDDGAETDYGRPSPPVTPVTEGRLTIDGSPSTRSIDSQPSSVQPSTSSMTAMSSRTLEGSTAGLRNRTIRTTVESLKGGCLRGEELPVRISIVHNKHVKSMHGVFLTVFRLARVNTQPPLPIGPTTTGDHDSDKKRVRDMYYPQSKTGLGGLSLSGTGTSHTYRKDLAQTVLPLIVDPTTLTAELTPKIRMPDDAFPTIAVVPGAMISFKYYVEVIIDIQGKAAAQDRSSHAMSAGLTDGHHREMVHNESPSRGGLETHASSVIDTAWLRREKSVVACTLEVVVGTHSSERRKAANKAPVLYDEHVIHTLPREGTPDCAQTPLGGTPDSRPLDDDQQILNINSGDHDIACERGQDAYLYDESWPENELYDEPAYAGPPEGYDEGLTEKERLQRAEAALMPSQPPGQDDEPDEHNNGPFVPFLDDRHEFYDCGYDDPNIGGSSLHGSSHQPQSWHATNREQLPGYVPRADLDESELHAGSEPQGPSGEVPDNLGAAAGAGLRDRSGP